MNCWKTNLQCIWWCDIQHLSTDLFVNIHCKNGPVILCVWYDVILCVWYDVILCVWYDVILCVWYDVILCVWYDVIPTSGLSRCVLTASTFKQMDSTLQPEYHKRSWVSVVQGGRYIYLKLLLIRNRFVMCINCWQESSPTIGHRR